MKKYAIDNIRNLCLMSHSGSGKTTLAEAMLYAAKAITRLGRVEDGSTTSDYDPAETKRNISINLATLPHEWNGFKLNLIDTPGYGDFVGEVKAAMRVCEGTVIPICAASGVEVGTERVWKFAEEAGLPRLIFVNKMDRENADFSSVVEGIQAKLGHKCTPLQLPIGAQDGFTGIVDLMTMKAYTGAEASEADIPEELKADAEAYREKLIEAIAEVDDTLIEKYLGGEELSTEELQKGFREAVAAGKVVPILAGAATKNIGVTGLMDAICAYIPSPAGTESATVDEAGKPAASLKLDKDAPLAALVFKTSADPFVGKLTYYRVYRGVLKGNTQLWNITQDENERIGQLFNLRGKNQEQTDAVEAGDIAAVAKLNVTNTGDTLCTREAPVRLAPIEFPAPVFSQAVHPKTKADVDKLGPSLTRLTEEDPSLHVHREPDTGETIISGMGETHLGVAAEKMQAKFGVGVDLGLPQVPYKETITTTIKAEYKHKKQTGGHGQYGHVKLELEPLPRGSGLEFADRIVGGSIPKNYIPAVEKGVNEAKSEGTLARYPIVDIKATVYDGSFHPVDSSEICFKIAGAGALRQGLSEGQPILLEPIMNLKVSIPDDCTGDVIGDLNSKRAKVLGMSPEDGVNVIDAQVPQAEVQRYTIDLRSMTQGRGSFTTEFDHYEEVPPNIADKIIEARQEKKE